MDKDGRMSGWGIWTYNNFRYEGYFADGMPSGFGTLYTTMRPPENKEPGRTYTERSVQEGTWANGLADGVLIDTWYMNDGGVHRWTYDVANGVAQEGIVAYCSECGASLENSWITGVPPWTDN
jgi:hypothetical protein